MNSPTPKKLMLVAGARPNFMKIAPVMRAIAARDDFDAVLVHTGQHYDEGMSDIFFRDLGIPTPDFHLNVGSGSHAVQTAAIMTAFEPVVADNPPDCVLVFGDVNSTAACSLVAKKLNLPVAHVEAGLRSGDRAMPEEINRIVTDAISDYFFVTEPSGVEHLLAEGKPQSAIFHVGHVMIDNLFAEVEKLAANPGDTPLSSALKAQLPRYGVVTMHRPSNVDERTQLGNIMGALGTVAEDLPLIFPAHPRTRKRMEEFDITAPEGMTVIDPLGYREFLNLWKDASLVLTDSGGLQEETTGLRIPCITMRENTERPVTVSEGSNQVVGADPQTIVRVARAALADADNQREFQRPALWDGRASERILDALQSVL